MDDNKIGKLIKDGRNFMQSFYCEAIDIKSDQQLGKPQPPLYKPAQSKHIIKLDKNFNNLNLMQDIVEIFYRRKSHRDYINKPISINELSYLCWVQAGVKKVLGDNYCIIRPVACGGARHEFELYMAVLNVEGLLSGAYHYLPETHSIELLYKVSDMTVFKKEIVSSLFEQTWASNSGVVFYYSIVPYRAEWRYSYRAHRVALMDSGHITQNLYIACTAAGIGACAIAALSPEQSNRIFNLDGNEEFIFYAATAGCVPPCSKAENEDYETFISQK